MGSSVNERELRQEVERVSDEVRAARARLAQLEDPATAQRALESLRERLTAAVARRDELQLVLHAHAALTSGDEPAHEELLQLRSQLERALRGEPVALSPTAERAARSRAALERDVPHRVLTWLNGGLLIVSLILMLLAGWRVLTS